MEKDPECAIMGDSYILTRIRGTISPMSHLLTRAILIALKRELCVEVSGCAYELAISSAYGCSSRSRVILVTYMAYGEFPSRWAKSETCLPILLIILRYSHFLKSSPLCRGRKTKRLALDLASIPVSWALIALLFKSNLHHLCET